MLWRVADTGTGKPAVTLPYKCSFTVLTGLHLAGSTCAGVSLDYADSELCLLRLHFKRSTAYSTTFGNIRSAVRVSWCEIEPQKIVLNLQGGFWNLLVARPGPFGLSVIINKPLNLITLKYWSWMRLTAML